MKTSIKRLITFTCILVFTMLSTVSCVANTTMPYGHVEKDVTSFVSDISLQYNHEDIDNNIIRANITDAGNIVNVLVEAQGDISTDYVLAIDDESIATLDDDGGITYLSYGETAVRAYMVEDPSINDSFLLEVVKPTTSESNEMYAVTVTDGYSNILQAKKGTIVSLTLVKTAQNADKTFVGWEFTTDVEWRNGNQFEMPAGDISIRAVFETKKYTLTLKNATFNDGTTEQDVYAESYPTLIASDATKAVIGWADVNDAYRVWASDFEMLNENATIEPIYSSATKTAITLSSDADNNAGAVYGGNGKATTINGVSAKKYSIAKGTAMFRVRGSSVDSSKNQYLSLTFRNDGETEMVFEYEFEFYGKIYKTQTITIYPGQVKTGLIHINKVSDVSKTVYHRIVMKKELTGTSSLSVGAVTYLI